MGEQRTPAVQGSRPTAAKRGDYGGTPACRGEGGAGAAQVKLGGERAGGRRKLLEVLREESKGVGRWRGGENTSVPHIHTVTWSLLSEQQAEVT